jgi:uncharacterized protein
MLDVVGYILLGLLSGTLAAALGVGGGVVYVPALVVIFSFDQHIAQGTSLAVILPTAVVATIAHTRHGNVQWKLAVPVAIAGIAGATMGATVALGLDEELLRRFFGVFLLIVAARMAWRAYKLSVRSAPAPDPS